TSPSCIRTRRTSRKSRISWASGCATRRGRWWCRARACTRRSSIARGARGHARPNWRLVQLPPTLAEYVVAHEVAHLVELNHSPRFWALVEQIMPGHVALRRELEDWTALLAA